MLFLTKNKNTVIVFAVLFLILLPFSTFAQIGGTGGPDGIDNPLKAKTISAFLEDVLEVVRNIGAIVAVIFLVYAGYLFVTAGGDETKLTKAKSAFLWAVIGTAVLLGAQILATGISESVDAIGGSSHYSHYSVSSNLGHDNV